MCSMSEILVDTENSSKDEQREWRNLGLVESDIATICGLNKYKSPIELWMEKTRQIEPIKPVKQHIGRM